MINKCYASTNSVGVPDENDMELINKFSLKPLTADDVFVFALNLCDNDIDRDFERFSEDSLYELQKLFIGKTGILNHSMKSEDQACRTFKTEVVHDSERLTVDGKPYIYLKANCYTVRSQKNDSLIRDIESGIKKEVSISCSAKERICSVCGKNGCSHISGQVYNGKTCHKTLGKITDAYEWSFVAVPAQRQAGVTKSKKFKKEKNMENILKAIKESNEITLKGIELTHLCDYINYLESASEDGKKYRAYLEEKAQKGFAVALPSLSEECVHEILKSVSSSQLETLCTALNKQASKILPTAPQLYSEGKDISSKLNQEFKF